ncbi:hypothetical protein SASPL_102485 [Salvia splendens]|uniref:Uncharacterized protein n=1 Tax=Salvia splendens TaxID=180675 RepID=A0A8X8YWC2_SALSN|nr:hypothetical protein SASPL_102485 [Salvia splendens]
MSVVLSQGSLGSMSAGGLSIETPTTMLAERRDRLDDFSSSGSEPFPPDTDSAQVSLDIIPTMSEEAIASMAVGKCSIPRLPRLYVGWSERQPFPLDTDSAQVSLDIILAMSEEAIASMAVSFVTVVEGIEGVLSQGSLGSMTAGGLSTETPTMVLDERRDRLDDFSSSGSEPFPPNTDSAQVSLDTILGMSEEAIASMAVFFVTAVKATHSFQGEGSSELYALVGKKMVDLVHELLVKEGPRFGVSPPAPGGDGAGAGGSGPEAGGSSRGPEVA